VRWWRIAAPALWFAAAVPAVAEVTLSGVFGDHMVLQRDVPVAVWGRAENGAEVTVRLGDRPAVKTTATDGAWRVQLPATPAGGPFDLVVKGGNEIRIADVLVGEVWLCAGQSNMEFPVKHADDVRGTKAAATDGLIRHLKVPVRTLSEPGAKLAAEWAVCRPDTVGEFTACGYFMARHLRKELKVPVGLINATLGGSKIEAWTPAIGFRDIPSLAAINRDVETTLAAMRAGPARGRPQGKPPRPFAERHEPKQCPTTLYNGMLHPLVGYRIRGAVWYQGEANRRDGMLYVDKMRALIGGWRTTWGSGDFPVHFVQIAPYRYPPDPKDAKGDGDPTLLARFWAAQAAAAAAIPGTSMAVINDIGDLRDAHPTNKQEVGRRLALLALHHTYGRTDLECSGPVFRKATVDGNTIRVAFEHAAGLRSRNGKPLSWFEVRGADADWTAAEATLAGETVVVSAADVAAPVAVRFAWSKLAEPNLVNAAGLPTAAFNTSPDANEPARKQPARAAD